MYVRFGGEEVGNLLSQDGKALISLAYYVSELLGKGTIDKKSSGETKGKQGSSSRNYDVLGRELFTPDEVRKLDNKKCILFIRGFDPIMDAKFIPFGHPAFGQTADGDGKAYIHVTNHGLEASTKHFEILGSKSLAYYEKQKEKKENVYIDTLDYEDFVLLSEIDLKKRFISMDEKEQRERMQREQENELRYTHEPEENEQRKGGDAEQEILDRRKIAGEDTIMNRMATWQYSGEQKAELRKMMDTGMPKESILGIFYPDMDAEQMREVRKTYEAIRNHGLHN